MICLWVGDRLVAVGPSIDGWHDVLGGPSDVRVLAHARSGPDNPILRSMGGGVCLVQDIDGSELPIRVRLHWFQ